MRPGITVTGLPPQTKRHKGLCFQQRFGGKVFDLFVVVCLPVLLTPWITRGWVVPHLRTRGRTHKAVLICPPASSFPSCPGLEGATPPAELPVGGYHILLCVFISL